MSGLKRLHSRNKNYFVFSCPSYSLVFRLLSDDSGNLIVWTRIWWVNRITSCLPYGITEDVPESMLDERLYTSLREGLWRSVPLSEKVYDVLCSCGWTSQGKQERNGKLELRIVIKGSLFEPRGGWRVEGTSQCPFYEREGAGSRSSEVIGRDRNGDQIGVESLDLRWCFI